MGKRGNMAQIPLDGLRHLDHPVFGNLQIVRQSPKPKESFVFPEKPSPPNRKFSKTKSDNSIVLNRVKPISTLQRSDSFEHPNDKVCSKKHANGTISSSCYSKENNSLKPWHSAELPTKEHRNILGNGCSETTNGVSGLQRTANGKRDLCRSVSNNSSVSASDSEDVPNCIRSIRNTSNFYRSMSLSRGSSIEEESEDGKSVEYRRRVSHLVDELLLDIYGKWYCNGMGLSFHKRRHSSSAQESDCCSTSGGASMPWKVQPYVPSQGVSDIQQRSRLNNKCVQELVMLVATLRADVQYAGAVLARQLKRRDALLSRQEKQNDVITAVLQAMSEKRSQDTKIRFSVMPYPGDSGFTQWHEAMKMVARLPGGIPPEFRRRLWLTLAEKHLQERGVDWSHAERFCFNEWSNPDDDELGVQIVKDLHRTGCSLFCGAAAEENQALLKRVLLAYARWNKAVGYCQGFNMLAALILQVMDRSETDSVKVMIYLIEGVLPESYFANNLRGLSVDMAVFRDLLRLRLPTLSRHLEQLQHEARDSATGTSYEPPLTNVFTMQWFLTLFSNCLPQSTVLRVWDLIFLEGNEVLLRTALAIWDGLADRIMAVDSADEFYSIMGVLTREMLEFGLMDTNNLIKTIVTIAPFPFPELPDLRDKYLYNITPWTHTVSTAARRGLKLFHSDDDDDEGTDEDDEKIAVAATYGISAVFRSSRRRDSMNRAPSPSSSLSALNFATSASDRDRLVPVLDISALKQQYVKLRERQRQAHIILTAACARQPLGPSAPNPVAMNHLLLGKTALLSVRGSGPPPGAVPPPRNAALKSAPKSHRGRQQHLNTSQGQLTSKSTLQPVPPQKQCQEQEEKSSGETLHWKDATRKKQRRGSKQDTSLVQETKIASGIEIPLIMEPEADDAGKDVDKDSDDSKSSTSTELCDEPDRLSDFDSEEPTSISDASSYAPSAAEQVVMKIPSPIKSGLPTPETVTPISPVKDDVLPVQEQFQIPVSLSSEIKCPDKLSSVQLVDVSVSDVTVVSPEFVSKAVSPMQESLSPEAESPEDISSNSNIVSVSVKSAVTQMEEPQFVQTEGILISDSFVLKLPSPLKESALLKEKQFSPHLTEDIPLKETIILEDIPFEGSISLEKEIISPQFSKDTISISPVSPEIFSLRTPERSDSEVEESSSLLVRELSSLRSYSPATGEVKTISELDFITDGTSTEELKDMNLMKMGSLSSEDLEKLDSDPSYTKHLPLISPMSDISPLEEDFVDDKLKDWPDRSPIKISGTSITKSSSSLEITDDKVGVLKNAKSVQNLRDISPTRLLGRTSPIYLSSEVSRTEDILRVRDIQETDSETKKQAVEMVLPEIEVTSTKSEGLSDDVDDNENVSKLLELNQRLHEKARIVEESNGDETNKLENEIDYAEMTDLLELDTNISLGRRNSERALQIIQENSEILQRIMLCQARRPSKLSEEESNGGTATIPSEAESIPTSSSAENVDIVTCQSIDVSSVDESNSVLTSVSPKDIITVKNLDEFSIVSTELPSPQIIVKSEEVSAVSPEKQSLTEENSSWQRRDSPVKDETAEKEETISKTESPYSFSFIHDDSLTFLKSDNRQTPPITSTRSFTLSPEIPSKQEHRFSFDYGDIKLSPDSRETKMHRLSSDDKFPSYFEDKPKYTRQFEEDYKETKSQKFQLSSDTISPRKRFDEVDSSVGEITTPHFPRRYSPETTVHSSYSSVSSKSTKDGLDFFDTPIISGSQTRPLSSSGLKWTDDNEFKTEKRLSRESPPLFDPTVSKYSYDSTSSTSWLTEKSRRERDTSPIKSFESRPSSHYSTLSSDLNASKSYTGIGRYDYSFTRSETRSTEADINYFSSDKGKSRDSHSPISSKDLSSRPLDSFSFKTLSDKSDKSSIDYEQKLSYSPTRRYTGDSSYSFHPSTSSTAEFSSGTQDVIRRTTSREQARPHSTIISDLDSMEVLNRSYSSSSIDGYLSRSRLDLTSSDSPEPGKSSLSSSFKPISDETPASSEKSRSILRSPIYELDSPKRTSPSSHYRHLSPRRDEFDSKISSKDSSPPRYSSFSDSNWDKDVYSSPSKSQYRKSPIDSERLTTDTSSPSASTSLSPKLGKPYSPPTSPTKSNKDIHVTLPPIKSSLGSPIKSKSKFDPFPPRPTTRQPKELGIKLGLYSPESSSKNGRTSGKKT